MSSPVTYEIAVAWNVTNWQEDPAFDDEYDDITNYVQHIAVTRGKDKEGGNHIAATLELVLVNTSHIFTPTYTLGPLYGLLKPRKQIRVVATHLEEEYPVYYGFISRYSIHPGWNDKYIYIYATDGLDLLARQLVNQNYDNRSVVTEGEALDNILNAAGWSAWRRWIDDTSGQTFNYPEVS
jgi:hypothetical protein